ncbi:hypothetical protein D3874_16175 [Oleomonas cavernae]|uniref:DUF2946 domain-containing protein n=1 Tax=Oleomonas cavernae TaxID=2320859 RepID=A0A418WED5_9PROT|nr:hypothetical protein [Oleomonas cavernae]RJF88362.1 hypothetical protein D3874_16175 [Oleomonas cavernae]
MAVALFKRLLTLVCVVSFLGGTMAQAMPLAMSAAAPCDMAMSMPATGDGMPCRQGKADMALCVPLLGCALAPASLPVPVTAAVANVAWSRAWFADLQATMAGRAIEPAIFPPIHLA